MQIFLGYFKDGWPFQDKNKSPPRQKHICSEIFSPENTSPVRNFKRSELNLSWILMTHEYLQNHLLTYLLNVYFACPTFSSNQKLNRSMKMFFYPLTIIARHSYKSTCSNSAKKNINDNEPTVAEQPTFWNTAIGNTQCLSAFTAWLVP